MMAKCEKCPIQDECKQLNEELRKQHGSDYTLCPLRVLADDVYARYMLPKKEL